MSGRRKGTNGRLRPSTTESPATKRTKLTRAEAIIADLVREYSGAQNKKNAADMAKYMRNKFEFFGIKTPERRAIDKKVNMFKYTGILNAFFK
jgi:hypothetical protein